MVTETTPAPASAGPTLKESNVRSITQERIVSALGKISCLCLMLVVCLSPAKSSEKIANRIVCREELSEAKREELAARLRSITGWTELKFDANGALGFETALIRGGWGAGGHL